MDDAASKRQAFYNVVSALHLTKFLPANVFAGTWSIFLFFQSDRIFTADFIDAVGDFLRAENSSLCCLLNFSETPSFEFDNASTIYLDGMVTQMDYEARLRGDGPATGWLYSMGRYGCASNKGEWAIYCEKDSDIAILGLRDANGLEKFGPAIQKFRAAPIEALYDGALADLFPFCDMSSEWRRELTSNYGKGVGSQASS